MGNNIGGMDSFSGKSWGKSRNLKTDLSGNHVVG